MAIARDPPSMLGLLMQRRIRQAQHLYSLREDQCLWLISHLKRVDFDYLKVIGSPLTVPVVSTLPFE